MKCFDLVVVSHLHWNFVWQRPQQLLSRLAKYHRILFVEEPVHAPADTPTLAAVVSEVMPGLCTLTPQVRAEDCGETPLWLWPCQDEIAQQVREAIRLLDFRHRVLWFYTPTPDFMVETVAAEMLVYDVMDELANFKFAPPKLKENEKRLLGQAAVVFTGGASMYEAKKRFNPNTHLFASGVNARHYATACDPDTVTPDWMQALPAGPRATYIGVIDERLDYDLIAQLAQARPDIQFLMCGPFAKVNPLDLPKGSNLHYPGQQRYADLPSILAGSDICLMPFALNDATRFISPTKTLEYMATHRPIVSTPIVDVVRFYSDVVYLADSPEQFLAQISAALKETPQERARKYLREEKILAEHAWDAIADNMETLMRREWAKITSSKTPAPSRHKSVSPPGGPTASSTSASNSSSVTSSGGVTNTTRRGKE